jgi:hypothetical protein
VAGLPFPATAGLGEARTGFTREADTVLKKIEGEQQRKSSGHDELSSAAMVLQRRGNTRLGLNFVNMTARAGARGSGGRGRAK